MHKHIHTVANTSITTSSNLQYIASLTLTDTQLYFAPASSSLSACTVYKQYTACTLYNLLHIAAGHQHLAPAPAQWKLDCILRYGIMVLPQLYKVWKGHKVCVTVCHCVCRLYKFTHAAHMYNVGCLSANLVLPPTPLCLCGGSELGGDDMMQCVHGPC